MVWVRLGSSAVVLCAAACAGATINDPWDREMRVLRAGPVSPGASRSTTDDKPLVAPVWIARADDDKGSKLAADARIAALPARPLRELSLKRSALRGVMTAGPQRFMSKVLLDPFFVEGRFVGFALTRFYEGDARFSPVDLRRGDVVVRVNGLPIGRPNEFMRAWDELKTAAEIRVEYLRGAEKRLLRVRIEDDTPKALRPGSSASSAGGPVDE